VWECGSEKLKSHGKIKGEDSRGRQETYVMPMQLLVPLPNDTMKRSNGIPSVVVGLLSQRSGMNSRLLGNIDSSWETSGIVMLYAPHVSLRPLHHPSPRRQHSDNGGGDRFWKREMTYDACPGRNDPVLVLKRSIVGAGITCTQAITHAYRFHDTCPEIRHLLQGKQIQLRTIRKCGNQVPVQSVVDVWRVDDVKGGDGQGEGRRLDAAANDNLRLIGQTLVCFVAGGEVGREDLLENGRLGVVVLDGLTPERAAY